MNLKNLQAVIHRAEHSAWHVWYLNFLCARAIPFNKPHGIKVRAIAPAAASVYIPYRKSNCNHLGGLHACALATGAEFCAGMMLLYHVNPASYRLIMRELSVTYAAQARSAVSTSVMLERETVHSLVELSTRGELDIPMIVEAHDTGGKHICRTSVLWQVKDWKLVRSTAAQKDAL